jgi:hypothetical protein
MRTFNKPSTTEYLRAGQVISLHEAYRIARAHNLKFTYSRLKGPIVVINEAWRSFKADPEGQAAA